MRLLPTRRKKAEAPDQASAPEVEGDGAVSREEVEAAANDPGGEPVGAARLDGDGARDADDDLEDDGPEEAPGDAAIAMAEAEGEGEGEPAPPPSREPTAGPPADDGPDGTGPDGTGPDGDGEARLPVSFYVEGLFKNDKPPGRDELERQAEADFRAAIAPALSPLRELVPDASSPEEAMEALAERQGEYVPDPEGPNSGFDPYRRGPADTAVYYRIRRHFEKPSRRVGFSRDWRPPPGLAKPELPSGQRSRRS